MDGEDDRNGEDEQDSDAEQNRCIHELPSQALVFAHITDLAR